MRLYFAASTLIYRDSLIKSDVKNILFAFPYAKNSLLRDFDDYLTKIKDVNLFLDSGAFSVWTLGQKIDKEEYCKFCLEMSKRFKHKLNSMQIVNLDVIPGKFRTRPTLEEVEESAKLGRENYFYLKEQGVNTIPVFHQHEDIKWLKLMEKDTDYIGISPANDIPTAGRIVWMDTVYAYLKDRVKTHSFGGISSKILTRYPLFSGDSSSWTVHYRYGRGMKFKYKMKPETKEGRKYMTDKEVKGYVDLEKFATRLWQTRGVNWKD